ncbi:glutamine synthetase family protein [Phyllobacterium sophorae]|nr:glutamine synthetase family protein [Phyllobacterium sophorae]
MSTTLSAGVDTGTAMFVNSDLSSVLRGRSFPVGRLPNLVQAGLPWVPINLLISPLNTIPGDNPFGPVGETRLIADLNAHVTLPSVGNRSAMLLHLSDIHDTDGSPWAVCPRAQLKRAIADLEREFGLRLLVGFEHEFYIYGSDNVPGPAFSVSSNRNGAALADAVCNALATGGITLEQFSAEYGEHQFEIASPPADTLTAADQAVLSREVIRDVTQTQGFRATFIPKPQPNQAGSGVHIHFSLWRSSKQPATAFKGKLTTEAGSFCAGILNNLASLIGFTTPSVNSFARHKPSSWVGVYSCIGERNREAAIRFCPRSSDEDGWHQNATLEFRVADATANPYLALAALIRAGLDGLRDSLEEPTNVDRDPAAMSEAERLAVGAHRLPTSISEVLEGIDRAGAAERWFGNLFWSAYRCTRLNDVADAEKAGDSYTERLSWAI